MSIRRILAAAASVVAFEASRSVRHLAERLLLYSVGAGQPPAPPAPEPAPEHVEDDVSDGVPLEVSTPENWPHVWRTTPEA